MLLVLSLEFVPKPKFNELINGRSQTNWNQKSNLLLLQRHYQSQHFWAKLDKKSYKNIDIYYIGYITIKKIDDYESIYNVNPLYQIVDEVDQHIKEKNGSRYLVFDSTDENKKSIKKINKTLG